MDIGRPIFLPSDFKLRFFDVARRTLPRLNRFVSFHIECFFPFIRTLDPRFSTLPCKLRSYIVPRSRRLFAAQMLLIIPARWNHVSIPRKILTCFSSFSSEDLTNRRTDSEKEMREMRGRARERWWHKKRATDRTKTE